MTKSPSPSSPRGGYGLRLSGLALVAGLLGLITPLLPSGAQAQSIGAATRVEFDLSHTERIGGVQVTTTDTQPGLDGGTSLTTTGNVVSTYGTHDVTVDAEVVATTAGTVRLRTEGEHVFDMTGTALPNDAWEVGDSDLLARATLVDELTLTGVPGPTATVELYFQIRGMAEALIDIDQPFGDLRYSLATQIRLEAITGLPHSSGSPHTSSLVFPGIFIFDDYDKTLFFDEYVMLSLDVNPTIPIPLTIEFEITPATNVQNAVEFGTLNAVGLHRPSFWDQGAELLGVVVKDNAGVAIPGATVSSQSGYDFPASEDPPPRFPPTSVILSPVAVIDSDLGEAGPTTPFEQMIDQSGLSVPFTSGQTGFDVYFSLPNATRTSGAFTANWQSATVTTLPLQGYVDFDLGSSQTIDRLAIWNATLEDIRVSVADDPLGPWTEVGQYTLPSHINFGSYDVDILDLNGFHTARYVRIEADSAYLINPSFTWATVGEVAVSALPAPEPALGGMLAVGALGLAALGRSRERRAAAAL